MTKHIVEKLAPRLEQALKRLGREPAQRLGWLLKFAEEDIDSLSPGRLVDLYDEMSAFEHRQKADVIAVEGDRVYQRKHWDDEDVVRSVQRKFKALMDDLFQKGKCYYDVEAQFSLYRDPSGGRIEQGFGADSEIRFFLAAFELLALEGHRVRNCAEPKCNRLFAATKRQAFCSPQCSQRVRTAKYRTAHRDVAQRLRRTAYVKKQRAKHGPAVKVTSRKKA